MINKNNMPAWLREEIEKQEEEKTIQSKPWETTEPTPEEPKEPKIFKNAPNDSPHFQTMAELYEISYLQTCESKMSEIMGLGIGQTVTFNYGAGNEKGHFIPAISSLQKSHGYFYTIDNDPMEKVMKVTRCLLDDWLIQNERLAFTVTDESKELAREVEKALPNCGQNVETDLKNFMRHVKAIEPAKNLKQGAFFEVPSKGLKRSLLVDLAEDMKDRGLIVIEREDRGIFEIQRLPDGVSTKIYYKHFATEAISATKQKALGDDCEVRLKNAIKSFKSLPLDDVLKVDPNFNQAKRDANVIPYVYLQRKFANLACFRNRKGGGTKAVQQTLDQLEAQELIKSISKVDCEDKFNTTAKHYYILF